MLGQAVEVIGDDASRRVALVEVFDAVDLELQALRDVARADAARVERLHALEGGQQFLRVDIGGHSVGRHQLVEWRTQIAVVVERFDDGAGERVLARVESQDIDLGMQVLAQADVGGDQVERAQVALRALRANARRRLLPAVALVGRVAARGEQEVRVGRLQVDFDTAGEFGLRSVVRAFLDFEKRVAAHRFLHFLREVERRQLQQSHGVLEARRDGVLLSLGRAQGGEIHDLLSVVWRDMQARCLPYVAGSMAAATQPPCHRREGRRRQPLASEGLVPSLWRRHG